MRNIDSIHTLVLYHKDLERGLTTVFPEAISSIIPSSVNLMLLSQDRCSICSNIDPLSARTSRLRHKRKLDWRMRMPKYICRGSECPKKVRVSQDVAERSRHILAQYFDYSED